MNKSVLPWCALVLAALFLLYEFAIQVSPSVMTAQLMRQYHVGAFRLGSALGTYFISYALIQLVAGASFDFLGPRLTLTAAILICAIGTLLVAGASHLIYLASGRFITGFGSATAYIGMMYIGRHYFGPKHFSKIVSLSGFLAASGAVLGLQPLACALHDLGWFKGMVMLSVLGFVLALGVCALVRSGPDQVRLPKKDLVLSHLKQVCFRPKLWACALYAFLNYAPITAFGALWGVPFLMVYDHVSKGEAATLISWVWVGIALGSLVGLKLVQMCASVTKVLMLFSCIGCISLAVVLFFHLPHVILGGLLFLMGLASAGQVLSFNVVHHVARRESLGLAMGFNNFFLVISGAVLQPLIGFMLGVYWSGKVHLGIPVYTADNYLFALSFLPLCYVLSVIIAWLWLKEAQEI